MIRLFLILLLFIPLSVQAADYTITLDGDGETVIDGDTFCSGACSAGDIIIIPSGTTGDTLLFRDLAGSSGNPIVIKNKSDGVAAIYNAGGNHGIIFLDCSWVDIEGNNYVSETYGITIDGVFGQYNHGGLKYYRCANMNASYIEIKNVTGGVAYNTDVYGVDDWDETDSRGAFRFHHLYIHDTGPSGFTEGMYLGKTTNGNFSQWTSLEIDNNVLHDIGADCIQAGQISTSGGTLKIHNNILDNCGSQDDANQNNSIVLNVEHYGAEIYENRVHNSNNDAVYVSGDGGSVNIHDNFILTADNHGLHVGGTASGSVIDENTINGALGNAIKTMSVADGSITNNCISNTGGFDVVSSWTGTISNNTSGLSTCLAPRYYIDVTNGNDSNGGFSHVDAWETIAKINSTISESGSDVYFLCNESWTGSQLVVDWAGTSGNRNVIGAYYTSGGVETVGVSGSKPIIDGNDMAPSNDNFGLVRTTGAPYTTIQDLHIRNSAGDGVEFADASHYGIAQRLKVHNTYRGNIDLYNSNDMTIDYNDLSIGAERRVAVGGTTWPCGGIRMRLSQRSKARWNFVYNQWGEGISAGNYGKVLYNVIQNTKSQHIYLNGRQYAEVAYNQILGTDDTTYEFDTGWHGAGITLRIEGNIYSNCANNKIHHNSVINTYAGIRVSSDQPTYNFANNKIHNNDFINNRYTFHVNNPDDEIDDAFDIKNNISHEPTLGHVLATGDTLNNWDCGYNIWHGGSPPASPFGGQTGDKTTDPTFGKDVWRGQTPTTADLTAANLAPTANVEDQGIDLGDDFDDSKDSRTTDYSTTDPDSNQDPIVVNLLDADAYGWNIGSWTIIDDVVPPVLSNLGITTQQQCGASVRLELITSENAYCRYSTNAAHTTYADMSANQFTYGENTTSHYELLDAETLQICGQNTTYYVICIDGDNNESERGSVVIDVAASGLPGGPPPISTGPGGLSVTFGTGDLKVRSPSTQ